MKSIGRVPCVMFEPCPCPNNDNARPGRDWYVRGGIVWPWAPTEERGSSYYTVDLVRRTTNSTDESQQCFTEEEARALAALLNGLRIGPAEEDRGVS